MPAFELQERVARPVLAIRLHSTVDEVPAILAVALPEVWHAAEASGQAPDGPPFARYLSELSDASRDLEYEAGIPLPSPAGAPQGRAIPEELPAGRVAVAWHVGPYETLGETYGALARWIGDQGLTVAGPMWEVYWTDPGTEPDPARWRTEVVIPVA
jgi:effector-binding domain-containing protein